LTFNRVTTRENLEEYRVRQKRCQEGSAKRKKTGHPLLSLAGIGGGVLKERTLKKKMPGEKVGVRLPRFCANLVAGGESFPGTERKKGT